MKDQAKTQVRRRPLVGLNEFPPFKRNQIRWALHCYRWKTGLSWEKYPYEIAHALGIRELGEGLNSRDPRGFVLEGQTPTPEKLRLYERFIQKVAPEYARAFDEDEFTTTFADYLGRYLHADWGNAEYLEDLCAAAAEMERRVFFGPTPASKLFEERTQASISVFRRIANTPFLLVSSVIIDTVFLFRRRLESFTPTVTDEPAISVQRYHHMFRSVVDLPFDDTMSISDFWTGLAVPFIGANCYLACFEDQQKRRYIAQLAPCSTTWPREDDQRPTITLYYGQASVDKPDIHCFMFRAINDGGLLPSTENNHMAGLIHEAAENFFATMKYGSKAGDKETK